MKTASIIFFALCVLIMASCRTVKTTTSRTSTTTQTDTFTERETIKLDTLRAGADSANIAVPIAVFNDSGITYLEKSNGRATVKIQRIKDVIYASANCDSLEKIIATKEREIQKLRTSTTKEVTTERKVITQNPLWLQLLLYGCAVFVLGLLIIKLITFLKNLSWVKITKV